MVTEMWLSAVFGCSCSLDGALAGHYASGVVVLWVEYPADRNVVVFSLWV